MSLIYIPETSIKPLKCSLELDSKNGSVRVKADRAKVTTFDSGQTTRLSS